MKLSIKISSLLFLTSCILITSCKKEVGPQNAEKGFVPKDRKVLILNEGNFGFGNASVSILNAKTKKIENNVFKTVNGFGIGDVLQSVTLHNNKYYFVVNNSGKIVVTDTNLVLQAEITGLNSPRYFGAKGNKGYVTDLKQNAVYVLDLSTNLIIKQIKTVGWTEQIAIHNNKVIVLDRGNYLNNSGSNKIYLIDIVGDTIQDSIATPLEPNSMILDKNNKLWVLCSGGFGMDFPALIRVNLITKLIEKKLTFSDKNESPFRLVKNGAGEELYFINNSVYKMNILDNNLPNSEFIPKNARNFYGLGMDFFTDEIYVTDVKNYIQNGEVFIFNISGNELYKFNSGIIPQYIF